MVLNEAIKAVNDGQPRKLVLVSGTIYPSARVTGNDIQAGTGRPSTLTFLDAAGKKRTVRLDEIQAIESMTPPIQGAP